MEINLNTLITILTQIAMVLSIIQSNRQSIRTLKETIDEMKIWIEKLTDRVTKLEIINGSKDIRD